MKDFSSQTRKLWFHLPQKIRFLLVGGFNTVISYLLFLLLFEGCRINYNPALIIQYIISINLSIFTMRFFVFESRGNFIHEYFKAWGAYLLLLLLNLLWLNLTDIFLKVYPAASQLVYVILVTILTYIIHKHFSFRRK